MELSSASLTSGCRDDHRPPRSGAERARRQAVRRRDDVRSRSSSRITTRCCTFDAYRAWQDRQRSGQVAVAKAAAIAAVQVTSDERKKARKKAARKAARKLKRARAAVALAPEAVEERAQRRSERRMRKMVEARIPGDPLAVGFLTYQKEGGKLSRAAWKRRTAQRTP